MNRTDEFISLERTFHELPKHASEADDVDFGGIFRVGERLNWSNLLKSFRLILLAEAGTGKTAEIRATARALRFDGKVAFFLRLEHIPDDLEIAFEVGSYAEFQAWLLGDNEGWLLLDSVDEARLRHPGDFELAIRKLGRAISNARERAHIIITGRTSAWRPRSDLLHCVTHLPYNPSIINTPEQEDTGNEDAIRTATREENSAYAGFRIVTLDDLTADQVAIFVAARGVADSRSFLEAVERADAWSFTARPQDLEELAAFWIEKGRIGSRLEIMRNSIDRRLEERDQNRAVARPLAKQRARDGACLLAAATTLSKEPKIRVPDGAHNATGIPVASVLPDWNEADQTTLLSRPIFDEAIYGAVRFHHRSVREYLTAEWFADLLSRETSRRSIESLFFREQYGVTIVTPTLRPILPWLAILDEKMRRRVLSIAPEIAFEGGDPSQLPLDDRRRILRDVCSQIADGTTSRSAQDYAAVQRFASEDLSTDVRALIRQYWENDDIVAFLMRMIWLGQIRDALPDVMAVALTSEAEQYRRRTSFRALRAIGSNNDLEKVHESFISEGAILDRDLLAELIEDIELNDKTVVWLLACLEKTPAKEKYSIDNLGEKLNRVVEQAPIEYLQTLIRGLDDLLSRPPIIERRYNEISQHYEWLLLPAAQAVQRLVIARHSCALHRHSLAVLRKLVAATTYQSDELHGDKTAFATLVPAWPDLNRALFWFDVEQTRIGIEKKAERLTDWWRASIFGALWRFEEADFEYAAGEIAVQAELDDRLVALSLAFEIYRRHGRPRAWRDRLKKLAVDGELADTLRTLLKPPAQPALRRSNERQRRWAKRRAKQMAIRAKNDAESKANLVANLPQLKLMVRDSPGTILNAMRYLFDRTRDDQNLARRWTEYNLRKLIPEFGDEVANFYRDTSVAFWRHHTPKLRSEGAPMNQTMFGTILGLVGLEIEAHETENWPTLLTAAEVTLACRYASFELNGFPTWLPLLFSAHPEIVADFLLTEIRYELSIEIATSDTHYILSDVSWSGEWSWALLAPPIAVSLAMAEPINLTNLGKLLKILQGSSLPDVELGALASAKCRTLGDIAHLARWFAVWTGVDPESAVSALSLRLGSFVSAEDRAALAMIYVTHLFTGRRSEQGGARQALLTPAILSRLYLLMNEHIRRGDDIDRAGTGVYTPGLRDDAQEARDGLFERLRKIPGKEAFLAVAEIARAHPERPWLARLAHERAETDGDLEEFTPTEVRELYDKHERTPRDHRQLAELAVMRLLDLKDDLEQGDSSVAAILRTVRKETDMRKYIGRELREKAFGRYVIPQEEELADARKPDLRFHGVGFDAPVPIELKLADKWTGPKLFERLENQLVGDYLRDARSRRGVLALVRTGQQARWDVPDGGRVDFEELAEALQKRGAELSLLHPMIDEITIIGIDLTKRDKMAKFGATITITRLRR